MKKLFSQAIFLSAAILLSLNATAQTSGDNDTTFNPADIGFGFGDGANSTVYTTAIQSDGKTIIGGNFTTYNGTAISRIARLNSDGTLELTAQAD